MAYESQFMRDPRTAWLIVGVLLAEFLLTVYLIVEAIYCAWLADREERRHEEDRA